MTYLVYCKKNELKLSELHQNIIFYVQSIYKETKNKTESSANLPGCLNVVITYKHNSTMKVNDYNKATATNFRNYVAAQPKNAKIY